MHKLFDEKLAKRIKKKLIDAGITQADLARKFNVTRQYIGMIINGKQENLDLETKILEELNVSDTRKISI